MMSICVAAAVKVLGEEQDSNNILCACFNKIKLYKIIALAISTALVLTALFANAQHNYYLELCMGCHGQIR